MSYDCMLALATQVAAMEARLDVRGVCVNIPEEAGAPGYLVNEVRVGGEGGQRYSSLSSILIIFSVHDRKRPEDKQRITIGMATCGFENLSSQVCEHGVPQLCLRPNVSITE